MNCPTELVLSIHADGELSDPRARAVQEHILGCRNCAAVFASLTQENVVLMGALGEEAAHHESADSRAVWEGAALSRYDSSRVATVWLACIVGLGTLSPVMQPLFRQSLPRPPLGFGWVGDVGGFAGLWALGSKLVSNMTEDQDIWVTLVGFSVTVLLALGALGLMTLGRRPALPLRAGVALTLLASLMHSGPARAAEIRHEEDGTVHVTSGETVEDTMFLAGKSVIVEGVVDGDVFAAGDRVEIKGTVRGNVYAAAEDLSVMGDVLGNVHAVGQSLEVSSNIGGSAFLAGQTVLLDDSSALAHGVFVAGETLRFRGAVGRALFFAGDQVDISGSVARAVSGYAGEFALASTGSIGGDLTVTVPSAEASEIDSRASVRGKTEVQVKQEDEKQDFLHVGFYLSVVARTLALLMLGLLAVVLFPALRPRAPGSSLEVLRNMGIGFLVLFATPVAILVAALTVIGIPTSLTLALAYVVLAYLSTLVLAYFLAARFPLLRRVHPALGTGLCLLVILLVVELPLVGTGLNFLVHLFGVGCLAVHLARLYTGRAVAA